MKRRLHTLRRAIADDRGVIGPAVAMLLIVSDVGVNGWKYVVEVLHHESVYES